MRHKVVRSGGPRRAGRWLPVALLLVAPGAVRAELSLGLRSGGAVALGGATADVAMRDFVDLQVPIQLDLLRRFGPRLSAGVYVAYGFGIARGANRELCEIFGCSFLLGRAGVQVVYEFHGRAIVPWAGAGLGYEVAHATVSPDARISVRSKRGGFEWLNVQGGADWRLGRSLALGPWVAATLAGFGADDDGAGGSGPAVHSWLQIGIRGRVSL